MFMKMCRRPPCSHVALSTVHQRPATKTGTAPLSPNRNSARELGEYGFHNLTVVGRGVDSEGFSPALRSAELRRRWQAESAPVLLMVGRVAAEKNVEHGLGRA